jgi:hypothetical protein
VGSWWNRTRAGVVLALVATLLSCSVDRNGLNVRPKLVDGGPDLAPDVVSPIDRRDVPTVAPDAADVPSTTMTDARDTQILPDAQDTSSGDTGLTCNPSTGVHLCGNVCVSNQSVNNCGPTSCQPCPVPANGAATCDGSACGISCDTGFVAQGSTCVGGACSASCELGATAVTPPGRRFPGTTSGVSTAAGSCGGGSAPEDVFRLVLAVTSDVFITTHGTSFDTVIYMRRGCCGAELACNDNADGRSTSMLSQLAVPPGTYDIFVDGATSRDSGAYTVDIFATPASQNPGETCGRPLRISNTPLVGNTCNYEDDYSPQTCTDLPNGGRDVVLYFVVDAVSTTVNFDTCAGTCIDSVLYTRDVCTQASTESACDDDSCTSSENCIDTPGQSRVTDTFRAGAHYLIVDSFPDRPLCGKFTVTPSGVPP